MTPAEAHRSCEERAESTIKNPAAPGAVHVGLIADSEGMVNKAHAGALAAGATEIHPPGAQHYDPRYDAAQVRYLDGYSLEFVYKSWQHGAE